MKSLVAVFGFLALSSEACDYSNVKNKFLRSALCEVSCGADCIYSSISGLTDFVQVSDAKEDYQLFLAKVNAFIQLKALSVALTNDQIYNFMSLFKRVGGAISVLDRLNHSGTLLAVGQCSWLMSAKSLSRSTATSSRIVEKLIGEVKGSKDQVDESVTTLQTQLDNEYKDLEEVEDDTVQGALVIYRAVKAINESCCKSWVSD